MQVGQASPQQATGAQQQADCPQTGLESLQTTTLPQKSLSWATGAKAPQAQESSLCRRVAVWRDLRPICGQSACCWVPVACCGLACPTCTMHSHLHDALSHHSSTERTVFSKTRFSERYLGTPQVHHLQHRGQPQGQTRGQTKTREGDHECVSGEGQSPSPLTYA